MGMSVDESVELIIERIRRSNKSGRPTSEIINKAIEGMNYDNTTKKEIVRCTRINDFIVAKSCPEIEELYDRVKKGFKTIEIQLFDHHIENDDELQKIIQCSKSEFFDVATVHAPLSLNNNYQLIDFFDLSNPVYRRVMEYTQTLAEYYNRKISVVFHTELQTGHVKRLPAYYSVLVHNLRNAIIKYPLVSYSIENVTPTSAGTDTYCAGAYKENVDLCKMLREDVNKDYFFTTLDTCHAITALRVAELMTEYGYKAPLATLEDFFAVNMLYCNNIHLASVKDLGYVKGTHGIAMNSDDDAELLQECVSLIQNYFSDNIQITLEVMEPDYFDVTEVVEFKRRLLTYWK